MIALLGLHGAGTASANNAGYQGPWGPKRDLDKVNNNFYINLLGVGSTPSNFKEVITPTEHFGNEHQFNTTNEPG